MTNFIALTEKMRHAQKEYFRLAAIAKKGDKAVWGDANKALKESKALELRVDEEITAYNQKERN